MRSRLCSRRRLLAVAVVASALVPGVAHLRLGEVAKGIGYLLVLALLNAAQFGAPFLDPDPGSAAFLAIAAFVLGLPLSFAAGRSAARLVSARA
jgi:hypothetical protein